MPKIQRGAASLELPDTLTFPEKAGQLTLDEVRRLSKPPRGLKKACDDAAHAIRKAGEGFSLPPHITPERISALGDLADEIDRVADDAESLSKQAQQARALVWDEAYQLLREVRDHVRAQSRRNPSLVDDFAPLNDYTARKK